MRLTKKQRKLIEERILGLATCDLKNKPNVVAVGCAKVVDDNMILITDNFMNKTKKNLLKNKKVALVVWSKDEKEGYQFKGTAQYLRLVNGRNLLKI